MTKQISENTSFKIDLKTLIWLGSLLITILTGYFTFKSELDSRFNTLEATDNAQIVQYQMKDNMQVMKIKLLVDGLEEIKEELKVLRSKVYE